MKYFDEKAYGFIYITTNKINGKKYIGQRRFYNGWENYLGSGKILNYAINKYGKENFAKEIVAIAYAKDELNKLEKEFIENYNAVKSNDYYNIAVGGNGGDTFHDRKHSQETKNKMSEIRKKIQYGKNNPASKKVICVTTQKVFECIKEGARFYKCDGSTIGRCCSGKRNATMSGKLPDGTPLKWMYYEDYLKQIKSNAS